MQQLRIMISSRCKTEINTKSGRPVTLTEIRKKIKEKIEDVQLLGINPFEVWISEEPRDVSARNSSWEECMSQVKQADLLISIYTGEAGWAKLTGDIGICHAELQTGIDTEPGKVFIINASEAVAKKIGSDTASTRFEEYAQRLNRFYNNASTKEEVEQIASEIVALATVRLAKMGRRESKKGKYSIGEALDWTRMNFDQRKAAIEEEIRQQFRESSQKVNADGTILYRQVSDEILFDVHGIPSGMSVNAAREMVGQPFLRDYKLIAKGKKGIGGPIHIIGVHKGVTETQALSMLGFPDAIVVEGPFGIYIADDIQKIQLVLMAQCRDGTATRHNVQKFMDWLTESGEYEQMIQRAQDRRKILDVICSVCK